MPNLNKVIIIGRLTADPELRQTTSGVSVCRFKIAVDRRYKDSDGVYPTDFIECQAWRNTAEFICKYFSKGKCIIVEGELQNNNYEKDGVKYYSYVVLASNVSFGESKSGASETGSPLPQSAQTPQNAQTASALSDQQEELGDFSDFEEILSDGEDPF